MIARASFPVSGLGSFSSSWSGRRFCYCVTNRTNDLTGGAPPGEDPRETARAAGLTCPAPRLHRPAAGRDGELHQLRPRALQIGVHPDRWAGLSGHVFLAASSGSDDGTVVCLSEPAEPVQLYLHLRDGGEDGSVPAEPRAPPRPRTRVFHPEPAGSPPGAAVPELWQLHPITPIFNRTIVEGRRPGALPAIFKCFHLLALNFSSSSFVAPETQQPTHRSRVSPAETATTTGNSWELTPQPRPEAPTRDPSPGLQPATRGPTRQQRGTEEASTSGTGRAATQPAPARTTLPSMLLRKPGKNGAKKEPPQREDADLRGSQVHPAGGSRTSP